MHRAGVDPKVKKTLVRNCEKNLKPATKKYVVRDNGSTSRAKTAKSSTLAKENELDEPTLCSTEVLAQYLSDVKVSSAPLLTAEDFNVDKGQISAKVTKKLNFHFNNRIYRNLIELNTNVEEQKKKNTRRSSSNSAKRDLEPNIEDFYQEDKDKDSPPTIPVIKPKFKPVKKVENGQLHKLVAKFENL